MGAAPAASAPPACLCWASLTTSVRFFLLKNSSSATTITSSSRPSFAGRSESIPSSSLRMSGLWWEYLPSAPRTRITTQSRPPRGTVRTALMRT